jgi:hypothetical protein
MTPRWSICEYTPAVADAVRRFNERLSAHGATVLFPDRAPPAAATDVYPRQSYYLALDDDGEVRGGYGLKFQEFQIARQIVPVADLRIPISEGRVDKAYTQVGVHLLLDALRRQPLLYGLGMGGFAEPVARLLAAAGWKICSVPFFFRVVHPVRFFRNLTYLRTSISRKLLLNLAAVSGAGALAVRSAQWLRGRRGGSLLDAELVDDFGPWADEIWHACRAHYPLAAVRDAATLRRLYPAENRALLRLQLRRNGRPVAWAILLDTQLSGHRQFGGMRLGSLVDCFAAPEDAASVVRAARRTFESRRVDLIISNQAHHTWCAALRADGFLSGPSNFLFASSRGLTALLESARITAADLHINRGDGDGPINL